MLQGGLVTVHPRTTVQSWGLDLDFRSLQEERTVSWLGLTLLSSSSFIFFFLGPHSVMLKDVTGVAQGIKWSAGD